MKKTRIYLAAALLLTSLSGSALHADAGDSTSAPEPPKREVLTRGMHHVGLTVSRLNASAAFFTDVLDWDLAGGFPEYPSQFVTDGRIFLTLWQATDPAGAVKFDRKRNVGLHHLALAVASFEALDVLNARFLEADGVVIEFAPELNRGGPTKHMMIREPSGNRIEFTYRPEAGSIGTSPRLDRTPD